MDFLDEIRFDIKHTCDKSTRDKSLVKLINSPAIRAGSLNKSKSNGGSTILLSSNRNDHCDRLNILLQEKQAGIKSNIIDEEIMAFLDKLFDYKRISTKQHRLLLRKYLHYLNNMR